MIYGSNNLPENNEFTCAFAAALHQQRFYKPDKDCLVASTVQEAMAKLGEIFRANMGYNPTHGIGATTPHPLLTRQSASANFNDSHVDMHRGLYPAFSTKPITTDILLIL
jgi:hypothetical protein